MRHIGKELFLFELVHFVCVILVDSSKPSRNIHRKILIVSARRSAQRASVDVNRNQSLTQEVNLFFPTFVCALNVEWHRVVRFVD